MPYGELVTKSWSIFWHHRMLWLIGAIFAVLSSVLAIPINMASFIFSPSASEDIDPMAVFGSFHWLTDNLPLILVVGGAVLLLALIMWIGSYLFLGALISATNSFDRGETATIRTSLTAGGTRYSRLLGLVVLFTTITLILGVLFFLPFFGVLINLIGGIPDSFLGFTRNGERIANELLSGSAVFALLGTFLLGLFLFLVFAAFLYVMFELASRAVVLDGRGVFAGIGKAFQMLGRAPGAVIVSWLIILGLGLAVNIVTGITASLFGLPVTAMNEILLQSRGFEVAAAVTAIPAFIATIMMMAISGIAMAYFASYWTVAYRRLTQITHPESVQDDAVLVHQASTPL